MRMGSDGERQHSVGFRSDPAGPPQEPEGAWWGPGMTVAPVGRCSPVPPAALSRLMTLFLPPGRVATLPDPARCVFVNSPGRRRSRSWKTPLAALEPRTVPSWR